MPAYIIVDMDVTDPALLEEYKKLTPATIARYGGRFLVRGGAFETLEGDWHPKRLVVLEFPSVDRAKAWVNSAEYAPARALRQRASNTNLVVVDGVPPG
ncbi:MAG: DUF1330 domain-containing protein [Acetobacteraceae bacterium]|nr:DUF1330 domain-containing protein [Acetobacteraceae bacterium]